MKKKRKFPAILAAAVLMVLFFQGCSDSTTGLSDEEKAVLVNKAIEDGGTSSNVPALTPSRSIVSGSINVDTAATYTDLAGSAFYTDVTSLWTVFGITYTNLAVSVTDDDGNSVTVVLNGSIYYGMYTLSTEFIVYGSVTGTVDGEPFSFALDLKTAIASDGSVTVTGTAGDTQINESY